MTAAREHHIHDNDAHEADSYSTKMIGLAKEVLLDTGLSVTALNHFIKCPNEFLYESIMKLPQAPSAAAEKELPCTKRSRGFGRTKID